MNGGRRTVTILLTRDVTAARGELADPNHPEPVEDPGETDRLQSGTLDASRRKPSGIMRRSPPY